MSDGTHKETGESLDERTSIRSTCSTPAELRSAVDPPRLGPDVCARAGRGDGERGGLDGLSGAREVDRGRREGEVRERFRERIRRGHAVGRLGGQGRHGRGLVDREGSVVVGVRGWRRREHKESFESQSQDCSARISE